MNIKKAEKTLRKAFKTFGIDFDFEVEKDHIKATCSLTLKGCDDDIYASFLFYEFGGCQYCFTFDKIEKSTHTLTLVNEFNENVLWFKAYIDDDYLRLEHPVRYMTDDALEEYTLRILQSMTDDDLKKYLFPLTSLTTN